MRLTVDQRAAVETRIRAAADRLLRGELPAGGKCDIKTLAADAGVTRSALYTTYQHLKDEFEQRRQRLRDIGTVTDPRDAHIERLTDQLERLTEQLLAARRDAREHTAFKTRAVSRLVAQHDELEHLRRQLAKPTPVRPLRPRSAPLIGPC
jgi:chromosome segregation ATPase